MSSLSGWVALFGIAIVSVSTFPYNCADAQITPDGTLPTNSSIQKESNTFNITGGTQSGGNLFHSFGEFSVPTGNTVFFNNAADIQNIISRVTGNSISNIDGLITANRTANLFLINPNGIVFGQNALLDIGGSFLASTASSLKFADGFEFSAINPQSVPLLSINVPVGLQYGANPGSILNQSQAIDDNGEFVGLEVKPEKTLALVGGDVVIEGGFLVAPSGRIELGSVAGNSFVSLKPNETGYNLGYQGIENFKDIHLTQEAFVATDGNSGGSIQVQGANVILADGSLISANTLGEGTGIGLVLNATQSVQMIGTSADGQQSSSLFTKSLRGATGDAGGLTINTRDLLVRDGAQISASTLGSGKGGNLSITADSVHLIGTSGDSQYPSGLSTSSEPGATGDAGNLTINTRDLLVRDGAVVTTDTFASGKGGNLSVIADSVQVIGTSADTQIASGLYAASNDGTGDAGNLTINTRNLLIRDGGQIVADTFSSGKGGNLSVIADSVQLIGNSADGYASKLSTSSEPGASGDAGNLTISTSNLLVQEGAQIGVGTFGLGKGGNLSINANSVEVVGVSGDGQHPSGLFTSSVRGATGDAGDLTISTSNLLVQDGAQIGAGTSSSGKGGNLSVIADSVQLIGVYAERYALSGLFASSQPGATGDAGNLTINTRDLLVRDGAQISASTLGAGKGGNLSVTAHSVKLIGNSAKIKATSGLFARTQGTGKAGDLLINTQSLLISNGAEATVSSRGESTAGNLVITASSVRLDNGQITAQTLSGNGGNLNFNIADLLQMRRGSEISTSAGTAQQGGDGGNIKIDSKYIIAIPEENSDITANAFTGTGGKVEINSQGIFGIESRPKPTEKSDITASSELGVSGVININAPDTSSIQNSFTELPPVIDTNALIANSCISRATKRQENSFTITGSGALTPNRPGVSVSTYTTGEVRGVETTSRPWKKGDPIIEPTGLYRLNNGQLLLSRECSN